MYRLKTCFRLAACFLAVLTSPLALAFDDVNISTANNTIRPFPDAPNCDIGIRNFNYYGDFTLGRAWVRLISPSGNPTTGDWIMGDIKSVPTVTASHIESCGFSNVHNVSSALLPLGLANDNLSWGEAEYMGFQFTADHPVHGEPTRWEVALKGRRNTVLSIISTELPTAVISGLPTDVADDFPFEFTVTFNQDVIGFDDIANDISITNGTVTAISGGPQVYTVTAASDEGGALGISLPAHAANNAIGARSQAADGGTIAYAPISTGALTQPGMAELTVIIDAEADGSYAVASSSASALNAQFSTNNGQAQFGPVDLDPGEHSVNLTLPEATGIRAGSCDSGGQFDVAAQTFSINVSAGDSVICTISTADSTNAAIAILKQAQEARAYLMHQHEPPLQRKIDRLSGRVTQRSGITANGTALNTSATPFDVQVDKNSASFTYSVQSESSAKHDPSLKINVASAASALGQEELGIALTQAGQSTAALTLENSDSVSDTPPTTEAATFDFWIEAKTTDLSGSSVKGSFSSLMFGMDRLLNKNLLVGLGIQADASQFSDLASDARVKGSGFVIFPYTTMKIGENLYLDARIGAGSSSDDVSPFDSYTDRVSAARTLATTTLMGDYVWRGIRLQPNVKLSYYQEKTKAYVDTLGGSVDSVKTSSGVLTFGPRVSKTYADSSAQVTTFISLQAVNRFMNESSADDVLSTMENDQSEFSGTISAGADILETKSGATYRFAIRLGGFGDKHSSSAGVDFSLNYPL